jgi:protocatechuate 3,4-dioxygenase beta subunit
MTEDMHPNPEPQRPMSRRSALALLGAAGLGAFAAACTRKISGAASSPSAAASPTGIGTTSGASGNAPGCVLTQEVTEGPYYLPLHLVRRDITEGKHGVPLQLDLQVVDATSCQPVAGAAIDIWHADALGVYSGVVPLGPSSSAPSTSGTFLRGVQNTGADGVATFKTIYPGWYMGRTPHIHVKVLLNDQTVHTGQLFFDDSLTASVYQKNAPYDTRPTADTTNASDNIYQQAGAAQAILGMKRQGSGYGGTMTMGVNT